MFQEFVSRRDTGKAIGMSMLPVLALLLLGAHQVAAEPELTFRDGRTIVWPSCVEKGAQYCTHLEFGEVCVQKSDVVSIRDSGRAAESLYRAPSVTLSEKAQREQAERRKRQDHENWRSVEESQQRRMREEEHRKSKSRTGYDESYDRD